MNSRRPRADSRAAAALPAPAARAMRRRAGTAAAFLKALANEQRLCILCTLVERPLSVGELNAEVDLSQSALSQHLAVLRAAGLVTTARRGQTIRYAVPAGDVRRVLTTLHDVFCAR
ncbi:MAG: winged helix-turn-helix transcriptional regulator [Gammaproteobacteria bacterium]|nr:winged helix-turn-helix transcriptional regulator [Gammaproteobacteria bacterium]